jgi:hypothetical protein
MERFVTGGVMEYSTDEKKSFRVWGEFLGYPKCCVDWFVNIHYTEREEGYMDTCHAKGSGFIPCPICNEKCHDKQSVVALVGRDVFEGKTNYLGMLKKTLNDVKSYKYKSIASKHNYDYTEYLFRLEVEL